MSVPIQLKLSSTNFTSKPKVYAGHDSYVDRPVAKFTRTHPEQKKQLAKVLRGLEADPFQSSLRLHALKGELEGLHAVSLTHAYRITLTLRMTRKEIVLLDIGTHDEVYR